MSYHVWGWLSSILFLLTWYGLWQQIQTVNRRRTLQLSSTRNLSLNQFSSSYLAFYANFIFGIVLSPFNHYLVWTRCGALLLLLFIQFRIWQDRQNKASLLVLLICSAGLLVGFGLMTVQPLAHSLQFTATVLMLIVTVILLQGTLHQCWIIWRSRSAGDVSLGLFVSIIIKDATTLAFALTMPIQQAWPLLVLNGSSILSRGLLVLLIMKFPSAQLQESQ